MLLPYNVDRPARRTPTITYALMGINVLIYLLTIGYSNVKMHGERAEYAQKLGIPLQDSSESSTDLSAPSDTSDSSGSGSGGSEQGFGTFAPARFGPPGPIRMQDGPPLPAPGEDGPAVPSADTPDMTDVGGSDLRQMMRTPQGQRMIWHLQHLGDALTLDIHPDVMDLLAYTPGEPSILALFTAMFLHADLEHIMGNMLFLWVFGRAVEDTLGRGLYLGAYFVCGFAATLLYHIMTKSFSPANLLIPSLGASGAIAGVQGLFAPRFYRTPVRLFYTNFTGARIFYLGTAAVGTMLAKGLGLGTSGYTFASLIVLAAIVMLGDDALWGEWKVAAAWLIAGWVTVFDLLPIVIQAFTGNEGGGVAHWAHIGGLLCGVLYAFLIGAHKEGKTEYLVDEARQSLDMRLGGNALESAQQVVMMKPDDPVGYQLLAEAYDRKENREEALKNYKIAVDKYLRRGERTAASQLYQEAMLRHPEWVLEAPQQFALGMQMAKDGDWKGAAESLAKLPYYYPEASEGEMAFIRSAQIYLEKLDNPVVAMQLLHEFGNRYPQSQWMEQATKLYEAASVRHSGGAST